MTQALHKNRLKPSINKYKLICGINGSEMPCANIGVT